MGCLFGYCGRPAQGLLERMQSALAHRCADGWERVSLAIGSDRVMEIGRGLPPWSQGPQVAMDEQRRLAMGFSGVVFNREEVNRRYGSADGTGLLSAFGDHPSEVLETLEGCFTLAAARDDRVFLVRDPSGIKALYWTLHKDRLVFAVEIKGLFADPLVQRSLRIAALPEYLTFSFVPGEGTMFESVSELQPGTILTYHAGRVVTRRHFLFERLEPDGDSRRPPRRYANAVRDALERSVAECCRVSDRPPSVFVSGGIDSSAVLAVAARRFDGSPLKTFSVHFGSEYANENSFVRLMVERYRTDHTWLEIRPEKFLGRMREIMRVLDDPIGDPITVPNFLLAEAASRVSPVVLNGEGGDPCFGGPKNIPMMLAGLYGAPAGKPGGKWMEWNYLHSFRKCFSDLGRILDPAVLKESGGEDALLAVITPFLEANPPAALLNKLMAMNIRLKGANLILVKVDKMTSANSVLAMPPLFSKRMVETSMACPPEIKLVGNVEKSVLKRAVEDIVPAPIVMRPKSGMMVPVRFWFRDEMRRYAKQVLARPHLKRVGFFNVDYATKLLDYERTEIEGSHHGLKLWMLVTFMLWYEQMIESPWAGARSHASRWIRAIRLLRGP